MEKIDLPDPREEANAERLAKLPPAKTLLEHFGRDDDDGQTIWVDLEGKPASKPVRMGGTGERGVMPLYNVLQSFYFVGCLSDTIGRLLGQKKPGRKILGFTFPRMVKIGENPKRVVDNFQATDLPFLESSFLFWLVRHEVEIQGIGNKASLAYTHATQAHQAFAAFNDSLSKGMGGKGLPSHAFDANGKPVPLNRKTRRAKGLN